MLYKYLFSILCGHLNLNQKGKKIEFDRLPVKPAGIPVRTGWTTKFEFKFELHQYLPVFDQTGPIYRYRTRPVWPVRSLIKILASPENVRENSIGSPALALMLPVAEDREHPADGDRYRIVRIAELDLLEIRRYRTTRSITSAARMLYCCCAGQLRFAWSVLRSMQQEERSVFPRQTHPTKILWVWSGHRFSDGISVCVVLLIGQTTGVWTWCGLDPSFSFFIFFVFLHMLSGHRGGDDTRLATELIGNLKSKCVLRYFCC